MTPEESIPMHRPLPDGAIMAVWTIYERPRDFPQGFVLRAQFAMKDNTVMADSIAWYADDPDKLRAIVPPGTVKLLPSANDDPSVLETWL